MLAHLLKYDSTQGRFGKEVIVKEGSFSIDGKEIKVFSDADPKNLPWKELDIDVVLECTGFFVAKEKAQFHIDAGATRLKPCVLGCSRCTTSLGLRGGVRRPSLLIMPLGFLAGLAPFMACRLGCWSGSFIISEFRQRCWVLCISPPVSFCVSPFPYSA